MSPTGRGPCSKSSTIWKRLGSASALTVSIMQVICPNTYIPVKVYYAKRIYKLGRRAAKSGLAAGKAGAGAGGGVAGAALGTFIRLVARHVEFEQGARWDVQFQATPAAVNNCAGSHGEPAFLLDDANGFASRATGGPHIFDDQSFFSGLQLKTAAQRHLPRTITLDENRAHAEAAGHFMRND